MSALVAKELQEQNKILEQLVGNYILNKIHPVNSIYMSVDSTDPQILFGGTWERMTDGFLVSADFTYTDEGGALKTVYAGQKGGEAVHTLTVGEMPEHSGHLWENDGMVYTGSANSRYLAVSDMSVTSAIGGRGWNDNDGEAYPSGVDRGGSLPHNNMPPYVAVYMWKRVA